MKKWLGLVLVLVLVGAGGAYVYQKEHSRTLPEHIVQSNTLGIAAFGRGEFVCRACESGVGGRGQ